MAEKLLEVMGNGKKAQRPPGLDLSDVQLKELLRQMLLLRTIDAKMLLLQRQGRVAFYGPVAGQEAGIVGSGFALDPRDWIFSALREGPLALLAENFGTALSTQKARQMPCHYAWRDANVVAWSSCIGTQLPHAVGAAMAMKYRGDPVVAVGYMGDGATSEGDFHVALNFAGVYQAPVVFVCQNNQWAISVPARMQTASASFAVKAEAYGFAGVRVDGNDVLAVYKVMKEAVEKARSGGGPTLLELVTYRIGPHSSSDDPTKYRDSAEVEPWKKRDPIERYRAYLTQLGLWSAQEEASVQAELDAMVQKGIEEAEGAPQPPPEWIVEDVYDEVPPRLVRQFEEWKRSNE
jgi:pyruvate dehydrogenase E1 component alpha subunit